MMQRVVTAAALSLAGTMAVALPAFAGAWSDQASTTGGSARCTMQTRSGALHDQIADIDCDVTDTLADNHPVYVAWWQDGFGKVQLWNHAGAGHTVHVHDSRQNGDGSFGTLFWKVCRQVLLGADNCSATISHRVGT